jgi:hypothetical protein
MSGSVMGQNIVWEGGAPIQGTVVSDVVVEGGEAAADASGESNVDVVEPPAVGSEEESPGPDSEEEESTEGET